MMHSGNIILVCVEC